MVGPHGGIQIVPIGRRAIGIHRQVEVLLKAHPPTVDEVGSPLVQLAEFFAGTFPLDCSYEASSQRFSIILTEPARKPKLLPDAGVVALSAVNEVLVIWPKEQWVAYARRNADRLAALSAALSREEEDD
jgi:hypothetical protein